MDVGIAICFILIVLCGFIAAKAVKKNTIKRW